MLRVLCCDIHVDSLSIFPLASDGTEVRKKWQKHVIKFNQLFVFSVSCANHRGNALLKNFIQDNETMATVKDMLVKSVHYIENSNKAMSLLK